MSKNNKSLKLFNFFKECYKEARSIIWPTPMYIWRQFIIVIAVSFVLVLILYFADLFFARFIVELKTLITK